MSDDLSHDVKWADMFAAAPGIDLLGEGERCATCGWPFNSSPCPGAASLPNGDDA